MLAKMCSNTNKIDSSTSSKLTNNQLSSHRDMIEFDEANTLYDTIIKGKYCYEKSKNKPGFSKMWKEKKREKFE
jgi:hypothetical protein